MSSVLWWVTERPGVGAAGLDVQHRRLDLDVVVAVERAPEAGDHRVADAEVAPRLLVDDQVGVALAEAGVGVGEPVPLVGQRAHGLGQQLERGDLDAQLALARRHHRAVHADPVAEVEPAERARTTSSPTTALETNSWISPSRSRIVAKISLPCSRISSSRPATATSTSVSVPGLQLAVCGAQLGQRRRAVEAVRVGVDPGVAQLRRAWRNAWLARPPVRCRTVARGRPRHWSQSVDRTGSPGSAATRVGDRWYGPADAQVDQLAVARRGGRASR